MSICSFAAVPSRVDIVLVTHAGPGFPPDRTLRGRGHPVVRTASAWRGAEGPASAPDAPVAAFCGVGRPADFLASLAFDVSVARFRALRDHQPIEGRLAQSLLAWAGEAPLVCTAKDAVRLPPSLRSRARWRDVELALPEALLARLPPWPG